MDRVRKLLDPSAPEPSTARGYLDLLGDDPATATESLAQRLMHSSALPAIYERVWRPTLLGLAKGPLGPTTGQEMTMLSDMLRLSHGDVVLDVACGPGNIARALATHVGDGGLVVGIDASRTMLDRAVRESERYTYRSRLAFVRGDAVDLPFTSGTFDAVSCFAALYLFDRPFDALSGMARVLRPGGRLAIMTTRSLPVLGEAFRAVSGVRMFGDDEVTGALEERGFTGIRRRTSGLIQFVSATR